MVDSEKNIIVIGDLFKSEYGDTEKFRSDIVDSLGNTIFSTSDEKGKIYAKGLKLGQRASGDKDAVRRDELSSDLEGYLKRDGSTPLVGNWAWGDYKLIGSASIPQDGTEANLQALYQFPESGGVASGADTTGSYDLTPVNAPGTTVDTPFGDAATFNGSNQYFRRNDTLGITGLPFSISAWVRTDSTSGLIMAVGLYSSYGGNYVYGIGVSHGRLYCRTADGSAIDQIFTPFIGDGEWHHIVAVWQSTSGRRVYLDGNLVGESGTAINYTLLNRFAIGVYYRPAIAYYWDGDIDEVSVWNKALSANEVKELHARRGRLELFRGEVEGNVSRQRNVVCRYPMLEADDTIYPIPGITGAYRHLRQLIQHGVGTSSNGTVAVTYPVPFKTGTSPIPNITPIDNQTLLVPFIAWVNPGLNNTGFNASVRVWNGSGWSLASDGTELSWIVAGEID